MLSQKIIKVKQSIKIFTMYILIHPIPIYISAYIYRLTLFLIFAIIRNNKKRIYMLTFKNIYITGKEETDQNDWCLAQNGHTEGWMSKYLVLENGLPKAFIGSELFDGGDERFYGYIEDSTKPTVLSNCTTEEKGTKVLITLDAELAKALYAKGKDYYSVASDCYLQPYAEDLHGNNLKDWGSPELEEMLEYVHGNIQDFSTFNNDELELVLFAVKELEKIRVPFSRHVNVEDPKETSYCFLCFTELSDMEIFYACNDYKEIYSGTVPFLELSQESRVHSFAMLTNQAFQTITPTEVTV